MARALFARFSSEWYRFGSVSLRRRLGPIPSPGGGVLRLDGRAIARELSRELSLVVYDYLPHTFADWDRFDHARSTAPWTHWAHESLA